MTNRQRRWSPSQSTHGSDQKVIITLQAIRNNIYYTCFQYYICTFILSYFILIGASRVRQIEQSCLSAKIVILWRLQDKILFPTLARPHLAIGKYCSYTNVYPVRFYQSNLMTNDENVLITRFGIFFLLLKNV